MYSGVWNDKKVAVKKLLLESQKVRERKRGRERERKRSYVQRKEHRAR